MRLLTQVRAVVRELAGRSGARTLKALPAALSRCTASRALTDLLGNHLTQGRADADQPVATPRRFARLLLTRPDNRRDEDTELIRDLTTPYPEMTQLPTQIPEFASLLTPAPGNGTGLTAWIAAVRASEPPHLHAFANGLELDRATVDATPTTPPVTGAPKASTPTPNASCGKCTDEQDSTSPPPHPPPEALTQSYHRA